jgi:hypothetical protein
LEEGESRDEDGSPVFASAAAFGPAGIPVVKAKGSAHAVQKPSSGRVLGSLADRTNLQEDLVEEGGAVMIDFRDALPECPPEGSSSGEAAATVCNARIAGSTYGMQSTSLALGIKIKHVLVGWACIMCTR